MSGNREDFVAYFILLGAGVLGYIGAAWWAAVAPVLLLGALRYGAQLRFAERHKHFGEERALAMAILATLLNSALFVGLAFALGRAIAWMSF